ncbi:MAG: flagellar assembly protein FliW [Candidatus Midichloria sp.]|nr:flagellar assembly protein FliW [Hyalomma marginatum]
MSNNAVDKRILSETEVISNKFGKFKVLKSSKITLPFGLIGIPKLKFYYIIENFNSTIDNFSLLQSTEREAVTFLLYHQEVNKSLINKIDIITTCMLIGMKKEDVDLFLIASLKKGVEGKTSIALNTKAPLIY